MHQRVKSELAAFLKQAALLLLVVLYSAGTLKLEWLHRLIHEHEPAGLHSAEQESNPCHQAIFHAAAQQACEHPTHLTADWKCPVCDIVCPPHLTGTNFDLAIYSPSAPEHTLLVPSEPDGQVFRHSSPRAPPVC